MTKRIILMHGKDANPSDKWYPWFIKEMKKSGIEIVVPALPGADDPVLEKWVAEIEQLHPGEQTVLIGHSRGGVAILRWLERQPEDVKVQKVILVATNAGDSEKMSKTENNRGFFTSEGYDFAKIKSHCNDFVVLHSRDDEWVPFEAGEENAKELGAKFLQFDDRGHFGIGAGVYEIPELLEQIM